jgi:hypothetical protein
MSCKVCALPKKGRLYDMRKSMFTFQNRSVTLLECSNVQITDENEKLKICKICLFKLKTKYILKKEQEQESNQAAEEDPNEEDFIIENDPNVLEIPTGTVISIYYFHRFLKIGSLFLVFLLYHRRRRILSKLFRLRGYMHFFRNALHQFHL